ncbi:hypothetical protein ACHHYP_20395 [Achlya hypogyna]|uniref:Uncharacterized protein n=1 Tax=Achlya hypogyna TaxID=1202772 RepID=A0A1V9ZJI9_ACHHY|nr:hypothetical protein ACHHYP_20395 [Achlya hypogyna]
MSVRERVTRRYPVDVTNALMADGVLAPSSTLEALNIVFSACAPTTAEAVDLRDFVAGARHAVHVSTSNFFSKAVIDAQAKRGPLPQNITDFLATACTPALSKKFLSQVAKSTSASRKFAVPQNVTKCAIVRAVYQQQGWREVLQLTVACEVVCSIKCAQSKSPVADERVNVDVVASFQSEITPSGDFDWILNGFGTTFAKHNDRHD